MFLSFVLGFDGAAQQLDSIGHLFSVPSASRCFLIYAALFSAVSPIVLRPGQLIIIIILSHFATNLSRFDSTNGLAGSITSHAWRLRKLEKQNSFVLFCLSLARNICAIRDLNKEADLHLLFCCFAQQVADGQEIHLLLWLNYF